MIDRVAGAEEPTREQVHDEPGAAHRESTVSGAPAPTRLDLDGASGAAAAQSPPVRVAVDALQRAVGNRYVTGQLPGIFDRHATWVSAMRAHRPPCARW